MNSAPGAAVPALAGAQGASIGRKKYMTFELPQRRRCHDHLLNSLSFLDMFGMVFVGRDGHGMT